MDSTPAPNVTESNPAIPPERLVKRLGSRNPRVADEAAQSLLALGDTGVDYLIADLNRSRKFQRPRAILLTLGIQVSLFACLGALPLPYLFGSDAWWPGVFGGMTWSIYAANLHSRRHRNALLTMARSPGSGVLPIFLNEQLVHDSSVLNAIAEAITFHLPGMSVDDIFALDAKQREQLYAVLKWLNPNGDKEKQATAARAVLHSLRASKDTLALSGVKHLASGKGLAKQYPDIQKMAQEVLPLLQPQAITDQQATLLRAGSAPLAPETLLRPAANTHSDAPQTLLRSAASENSTPPQPVRLRLPVEENTQVTVGLQEERKP